MPSPHKPEPRGPIHVRADGWEPWLTPVVEALDVSMKLVGLDGAPVYAWGRPMEACEAHPIRLGGEPILSLWLSPRTPPECRRAIQAVVEHHLSSRFTIQDMARALAVAWKNANFLSSLSRLLQESLEIDQAFAPFVQQLAHSQRADAAAMGLARDGAITVVAAYPEAPTEAWDLGAAARACAGGDPLIVHEGGSHSLYLPLLEGAELLGLVCLRGEESLVHAGNLQFLSSVAALVAAALRLRHLFNVQVEATELRQHLALAADIQRGLLPPGPVDYPGVKMAGQCRMAEIVGGDGYAYIPHQRGLDIVVADVSGHGVAAGLLMSSFFGKVRIQDLNILSPFQVAIRANRHICQEVRQSGHFVTAVYARLSPDARELTYTTLGHHSPLLWRRGEVAVLPSTSGLPAGMSEVGYYDEQRVALEAGDVLVFFTDGLIEARSPDGELFGLERLCQALAEVAGDEPEAILQALFAASHRFAGEGPPADDQTAVVVKVEE